MIDLTGLTVPQLQVTAKSLGMTGYSKLPKPKLIGAIRATMDLIETAEAARVKPAKVTPRMDNYKRAHHYTVQRGGAPLTARQNRRLRHKEPRGTYGRVK